VAPLRRRALETLDSPGETAPDRPREAVPPELSYAVRTDPDLAWLAERDGQPLGYALGVVRDGLCTVSHLFVDPAAHGRDIGRELLRRLLSAAEARGATRRWVVASSSYAAHALYLRAGMYDRATLYPLRGPIEALLALPRPAGAARVQRPAPCQEWLDRLDALDRDVRGAAHREDHAFFLDLPDARCRVISGARDGVRGYVYYWDGGHLGPLAAAEPELQLSLLRLAADELRASNIDAVTLHVASVNETVLSALMGRRFTIRRLNTLMASGVWGKPDRYLPSGGVLM
jgi:ribosomal protein S18 acetylase RimI-like enzyme